MPIPITTNTNTQFGEGYKRVGATEANTYILSQNDVKDYIKYFDTAPKGTDWNYLRAKNQPVGERWARTILNPIVNIPIKLLGDVGYIADLIGLDTPTGSGIMDFDNALIRASDAALNPFGEVYRRNPDKVWDLKDMGWYADNIGQVVTSIGEFAALTPGVGMVIGGLVKSVARTAGAVSKATKLGSFIGAARPVLKAGKYAELVGTSAVLAYTEGAQMAHAKIPELYEYNKRMLELDNIRRKEQGEEIIPNDEIEQMAQDIALKGARTTALVNTLLVTPVNLTGVGMILRSSRYLAFKKMLKDPKYKNAFDELKHTVKKGGDTAPILAKIKAIDPTIMQTPMWKALLREGSQELIEEQVLNNIAESAGSIVGNKSDDVIERIFSEQGFLEGMLGFLGGVGQAGIVSNIKFYKKRDSNGKVIGRESARQQELRHKVEEANRFKESIGKDIDVLVNSFNTINNYKKEDIVKVEEAKRNLADIMSFNTVRYGDATLLKEMYNSILQLDNTNDLEKQEGITEAMQAGFAIDKTDNYYKSEAAQQLQNLDMLEKIYKESAEGYGLLGEKFHLSGLTEYVFLLKGYEYLNKQKIGKVQTELTKVANEISQIENNKNLKPGFVSILGRLKALQNYKDILEAELEHDLSLAKDELTRDKLKSKYSTNDTMNIEKTVIAVNNSKLKDVTNQINEIEKEINNSYGNYLDENSKYVQLKGKFEILDLQKRTLLEDIEKLENDSAKHNKSIKNYKQGKQTNKGVKNLNKATEELNKRQEDLIKRKNKIEETRTELNKKKAEVFSKDLALVNNHVKLTQLLYKLQAKDKFYQNKITELNKSNFNDKFVKVWERNIDQQINSIESENFKLFKNELSKIDFKDINAINKLKEDYPEYADYTEAQLIKLINEEATSLAIFDPNRIDIPNIEIDIEKLIENKKQNKKVKKETKTVKEDKKTNIEKTILGSFANTIKKTVNSKGSSNGRTIKTELTSKINSDGEVIIFKSKSTFTDDGTGVITSSSSMTIEEFKQHFYPMFTTEEIEMFEESLEIYKKTGWNGKIYFKELRIGSSKANNLKGQINLDIMIGLGNNYGFTLTKKLTDTELKILEQETIETKEDKKETEIKEKDVNDILYIELLRNELITRYTSLIENDSLKLIKDETKKLLNELGDFTKTPSLLKTASLEDMMFYTSLLSVLYTNIIHNNNKEIINTIIERLNTIKVFIENIEYNKEEDLKYINDKLNEFNSLLGTENEGDTGSTQNDIEAENNPEERDNIEDIVSKNEIDIKKADIEKRRQEELTKVNQKIEKLNQKEDKRVKVETYRTLDVYDNPVEVKISTNKDGSRILKARQINKDGSVESMAYVTERINNKAQLSLTNEKLIEGYIGNEGNTIQRTNLDENPDQTYIDKINAKYDAELQALEQKNELINEEPELNTTGEQNLSLKIIEGSVSVAYVDVDRVKIPFEDGYKIITIDGNNRSFNPLYASDFAKQGSQVRLSIYKKNIETETGIIVYNEVKDNYEELPIAIEILDNKTNKWIQVGFLHTSNWIKEIGSQGVPNNVADFVNKGENVINNYVEQVSTINNIRQSLFELFKNNDFVYSSVTAKSTGWITLNPKLEEGKPVLTPNGKFIQEQQVVNDVIPEEAPFFFSILSNENFYSAHNVEFNINQLIIEKYKNKTKLNAYEKELLDKAFDGVLKLDTNVTANMKKINGRTLLVVPTPNNTFKPILVEKESRLAAIKIGETTMQENVINLFKMFFNEELKTKYNKQLNDLNLNTLISNDDFFFYWNSLFNLTGYEIRFQNYKGEQQIKITDKAGVIYYLTNKELSIKQGNTVTTIEHNFDTELLAKRIPILRVNSIKVKADSVNNTTDITPIFNTNITINPLTGLALTKHTHTTSLAKPIKSDNGEYTVFHHPSVLISPDFTIDNIKPEVIKEKELTEEEQSINVFDNAMFNPDIETVEETKIEFNPNAILEHLQETEMFSNWFGYDNSSQEVITLDLTENTNITNSKGEVFDFRRFIDKGELPFTDEEIELYKKSSTVNSLVEFLKHCK